MQDCLASTNTAMMESPYRRMLFMTRGGLFTTKISAALSVSSSGHCCKLRWRSSSRGGAEASILAVAFGLWFWSQRRRRIGSGNASSAKPAATSQFVRPFADGSVWSAM